MSRWLSSGLRRDLCVVVHSLDSPTGQECKAALEDHYDDHLTPKTFYGALDALVDAGHVSETPDGIHDRYELTDAGRRALLAHHEWMSDRL